MNRPSVLPMLLIASISCASAYAQTQDVRQEVAARSFFSDRRALAPGDALTVLITEFSTVQASAQTSTRKNESASLSFLQPDGVAHALSGDFESDFEGGGRIERSGRLVAKLAVTVVSVDARGNLLVQGEQDIQVNDERQRISIRGFVRPEDISADNTIPSWRVGGAQIEFTGKGLLARKQAPGIITRILSWFWQ
jgi:flagellar L-ring protein FlgH